MRLTPFRGDESQNRDFDAMAKQLLDAVKSHGKLQRPPDMDAWAMQFKRLVRAFPKGTVQTALSWYCNHLQEKGVPRLYSAQSFRKRFSDILTLAAQADDPSEIVPQEIRKLSNRLVNELNFPLEIRANLPIILKRTEEGTQKLIQTIHSNKERLWPDPQSRERQFLSWIGVLLPYLPESWGVMLHERFGFMQHYGQPPLRLVLRPDHPLFRDQFWRVWSLEYTGHATTHDDTLQQIVKCY